MISTTLAADTNEESSPKHSRLNRFFRVLFKRKIVLVSAVTVVVIVFSAVFAPLVAPYDPYEPNFLARLQKPSWQHPLGTDSLGRDTLTRIIYGSRASLQVGFMAVFVASSIGMVLGLVAGYFGGIINTIIMRSIDALMSIPMMVLALAIASLLGGGLLNVIIALGVAMVPAYARVVCAQALSVKQNDYVTAFRSIGASHLRTLMLRVAPNCLPPLFIVMTMQMGIAILVEAGLSFLGVGISDPEASWGSMVSEGYAYLYEAPFLSFAPGIAIILIVFSFNMIGDGLRDALDPKLRGVI